MGRFHIGKGTDKDLMAFDNVFEDSFEPIRTWKVFKRQENVFLIPLPAFFCSEGGEESRGSEEQGLDEIDFLPTRDLENDI